MEITDLRLYSLGQLQDPDLTRLEKQLMVDDDTFTQLLMEEDDLIDDYLDGALSPDERVRFETFFLAARTRREKLDFASALREHLKQDNRGSSWGLKVRSFWELMLPRKASLLPVFGLLLLSIIGGIVWYVIHGTKADPLLEIASTVRDADSPGAPSLKIDPNVSRVTLQFWLEDAQQSTYRTRLLTDSKEVIGTWQEAQSEQAQGVYRLRVPLSVEGLKAGSYQIESEKRNQEGIWGSRELRSFSLVFSATR